MVWVFPCWLIEFMITVTVTAQVNIVGKVGVGGKVLIL